MKRLADKAVVIGAGSAIQSAGNALITIVLTRLFASPAELGAYRQVWLLIQTFLPLFLLGLPHAYYFYLPGLPRDQWRRFVWRTVTMLTLAGGVFSLAIFLFPDPIARGLGNPGLGPTLRDFSLYPLFTAPAMLLFPFQVAAQRDVRATAINLVFFLAQSFLIIGMLLGGFDLRTTLRACVVLAAIRFAHALFEFDRGMRLDRQQAAHQVNDEVVKITPASGVDRVEATPAPGVARVEATPAPAVGRVEITPASGADPASIDSVSYDPGRPDSASYDPETYAAAMPVPVSSVPRRSVRSAFAPSLKSALAYSLPAGLSNVATVLGQRLDRFVVSAGLGTAAFGIYSVGSVEFPGIVLVSNASTTVMRPQISRLFHEGKKDEILSFFLESCRKQAVLVVPMIVFLTIYAREFISVLYTPVYTSGTPVFQIFLLIGLSRIIGHGVILTSVGQTRTVLWGTLGFLAINLGLSLWWVHPFGMIGPPLATFVGTVALTAFFVARSAKFLDRPWADVMPVAMLARSFAVAGAAGVGSWAIRWLGFGDLPSLLLGGCVFAILYLAIGIRAQWIRSADLDIARRWMTLRPMRGRRE